MKEIAYSKQSLKTLRRMPPDLAKKIMAKVSQYAHDPAAQANNIKALKDSAYIRLRVGDWRVIMDDQGNVLNVLKIGARGDVYD